MESKFLVSFLILGLISTVLAKGGRHRRRDDDRHHHGKHPERKCPLPFTPTELPMKCSVSEDCSTFSCSADVEGESISLTLKIDGSKEPSTAEISLKVPSKGFDWSHTFQNGEKIQVPGFPLNIKGLVGADMYLVVNMYKGDWGLSFKVDLHLETSVPSEVVIVHLLRGKIPPPPPGMEDDDPEPYEHHHWGKCSKLKWWFKRQSKPVKAAIIISAILVIALLISGIVYCCKKRRIGKHVKVMPPSYAEATTTETKVPLEKLINEE